MYDKAYSRVSEYFDNPQVSDDSSLVQEILSVEFLIMKAKILLKLAAKCKSEDVEEQSELRYRHFEEAREAIDSLKRMITSRYGAESEKFTNALILDSKYKLEQDEYVDAYHVLEGKAERIVEPDAVSFQVSAQEEA